ncbi:MAG: hypothetical protein AB7Q42_10345 [Acidimicrobiia bacterium]
MTTTSLPHPTTNDRIFSSALARPLLDEWERLRSTRRTRAAIAAWELPGGVRVTGPDELLDHLGFFGRLDDDDADAALFYVVRLAADDLLAARVVLQRVLPALVAVAKRRGGGRWEARQDAFVEVVSAAWIVIRSYPVERRPRRVAANIVRDAEYQAFVRARRLRSAGEQVGRLPVEVDGTVDRQGRAVDRPTEPMEEALAVLREARESGLSDDDLRFAGGLLSGRTASQMASEFGMCERSVRNRRALVASRLRAAVLAADAA